MMVLLFIDYKIVGYAYVAIYIVSLLFLLLPYVPCDQVRGKSSGAMSWINLGPIDLQTSEISKIGYIIFLSKFIVRAWH